MNVNFTFRDFIVYFLTGISFLLGLALIYWTNPLFLCSNFYQIEFAKEYSILITVFTISTIYILGHLIGMVDTLIMKYYCFMYNKLKNNKNIIIKIFMKLSEILLYRQRISYHAIQQSKFGEPKYSTVDDFWCLCAKLQKENNYSYAEYWYIMNDLFKNLSIVSLICIIISIFKQEYLLILTFSVLEILFVSRAIQFAKYFVLTVRRISKI
ncbi:MAG: hypothetical protein N2321_12645 [Melioribacteraceae bacterium]|nr:hypothetical protein [Melioribacteraceae bacterium]